MMRADRPKTSESVPKQPLESSFGLLKTESVHHTVYHTRQGAQTDIFFCIQGFYNRKRRHTALDYLSPADFEAAHALPAVLERYDSVSIDPG